MAAPPTPTLGEIAYTAYWRGLAPLRLPWDRLAAREQRAWQAAARAAIRAWDSATGQVVARMVRGED